MSRSPRWWEANHVWLVFDLVIFWTAFPHAFAAVMTVAALPLWLALAGIVLRGAGFAFRKEAQGLRTQRALGATFAFSSLLTPFFMGTVIGAIATGQVTADASHASLPAWTSATSLLTGFVSPAPAATSRPSTWSARRPAEATAACRPTSPAAPRPPGS
jgi:cytochrome d ubiquinol oxidase subunit II